MIVEDTILLKKKDKVKPKAGEVILEIAKGTSNITMGPVTPAPVPAPVPAAPSPVPAFEPEPGVDLP